MEYLFFDCESANCRTDGNIFSFGYVVTDEHFNVTEECKDIIINPKSKFDPYVKKNILAYDMQEVRSAPDFSQRYDTLKKILCKEDRLLVGYGVENDVKFFKGDCKRYGLEMPFSEVFDVQKLIVRVENKPFRKLSIEYAERLGDDDCGAHRSDRDAYLTMMVARDVCLKNSVSLLDYAKTQAAYDRKQEACKAAAKRRAEREKRKEKALFAVKEQKNED